MAHSAKRCRRASWHFPLIAILLLVSAAQISAQAQKVVAIEVKGNNAISTEAILSALRTAIGADLSQQQVDEDRRSLERLGFFHEVTTYVEPAPGGVKVVFSVVENPKVTKIEITGNTKVPEAELRKVMLTQEGAVFSEATLEKDIAAIHKL
ncbi:MAG TPA: POTRA domain-containing protein [Armatimonadota bacterium]|nr:POTRA domain-containing protein [Armatimonadota bacterium]